MNTKHLGNGHSNRAFRREHTRIEPIVRTLRGIPNDNASARAYLRKVAAGARTGFIQISNPGSAYDNLALQLHAESLIVNCAAAVRAFLYQGGSREEAYELLRSLIPDEFLDR